MPSITRTRDGSREPNRKGATGINPSGRSVVFEAFVKVSVAEFPPPA